MRRQVGSRRRLGSRQACALLALVAGMTLGCGSDKGGLVGPPITTVPESWRGVWRVSAQYRLCGTSVALFDTSAVVSLCPGDSLVPPMDYEADSLCAQGSLVATATSLHFTCTRTWSDSCSGTGTVTLDVAIDGRAGTLSGTGQLRIAFTPETAACQDLCAAFAISGTREPGLQADCPRAKPGIFRAVLPRRIWMPAR